MHKVLNKTLELYEAREIFLSFNGGKDCTVLLHMFASLFTKRYPNKTLLCLYIQPESPFDEIEDFIRECEQTYRIQMETIRGTVKGSLFEICQRYPYLKAVVMGCRRTDPYCSDLNEFQKTDLSWPQLMRVNPLLDWNCKDIWDYLHEKDVPYCSLYKKGYTSVGDRTNTVPNPYLKRANSIPGKDEYLHADQLINADEYERAGRL
ncbi:FAD synthase-like isoform X2 [Sitodiplosis mosellana]|uniref:FAD synthase-like isoform X2 n=1 Tax=Sitodiplosis mosellana TaxID=263140 RepID=UPI002444F54D|nr:FAD synthase-like isoform X2 [Sitodiplosis mosellana]